MYYICSTYSLIPTVQNILFVSILVVCIFLGIALIIKTYKSYALPLKLKHWIIVISTTLVVGFIIYTGFVLSALNSKLEGLFTSYHNKHKFNDITFYTYEDQFIFTFSDVRYSEKGEWISHPIKEISFSGNADEIRIKKTDACFIIFNMKKSYYFYPKRLKKF